MIAVDLDKPEKASLFDYFSSIELIPLETSDDCLVARISKIINHQDKFYVFDIRQSIIFVFDQSGNFIFKIAKKGQGPGEYSFIQDFNINPFSGNLELLEPYGSVHIYDLSGNYIESKRIGYDGFQAVHMFAPVDSAIHVFYAMFQHKKIIYFDLDKRELLHEEFEENRDLSYYGYKNLYQYKDDWYFFRPYHPVVYKLGKNRLEPSFQFDFGSYTREGLTAYFSDESKNSRSKFVEESFAQFPYVLLTERHNNQYIFTTLLWRNENQRVNMVFDKTKEKAKFIPEFAEQVSFDPDIITDDFILKICHRDELEQFLNVNMLNDKQKEIFESLVSSDMETNPIILKYRFK
jgi:hypothetical protein